VGRVDRKAFKTMMESAPYTIDAFEVKDDAEVRLLNRPAICQLDRRRATPPPPDGTGTFTV
jgi:hypothetical protein